MQAIAAFTDCSVPRFVPVEMPSGPCADEVLCRTMELGVCGTDREILHSLRPLVPAGSDYLVLGHECLAEVVRVGNRDAPLRPGDLVVPVVRRRMPHAQPHRVDLLGFGEYTERGIVREHGFSAPYWLDRPEHLFPIPRALAPWAVLTEPFSVAEKGVHEALTIQRARLSANCWGDRPPRVLVTGMGPIGFAAIAVCHCRNWPTTMFGRDAPDSSRAALASAFGAEYRIDGQDGLIDGEYDLILECTGSDSVMVKAARSLAPRGVMVWLGSSRTPQPLTLNVAQMMRDGVLRNHVHVGCVNAAPRDFLDAIAHLDLLRHSHPRQLTSLITARVSPEQSLWHYEHREPQGIKTVVDFRAPM